MPCAVCAAARGQWLPPEEEPAAPDEPPAAPPVLGDGLAVLPLEGEPPPIAGGAVDDERAGAELPLPAFLPALDEPELSQAAIEKAARNVAAINHLPVIESSPYHADCLAPDLRSPAIAANNRGHGANIPRPNFHT